MATWCVQVQRDIFLFKSYYIQRSTFQNHSAYAYFYGLWTSKAIYHFDINAVRIESHQKERYYESSMKGSKKVNSEQSKRRKKKS